MPRKILVGKNLEEYQNTKTENYDTTPRVVSEGTRVPNKPSNMSARREMSFRELLREQSKRELTPDRENIKELREEGIFEGKSYIDNATNKEVIEFVGPDGQIELSGGYNNEITLEELADITAFKYGEKTTDQRNIFMDVNGEKIPVKEGEVTKVGLMNSYAQTQGFKDYKDMKAKENEGKYIPEAREWD